MIKITKIIMLAIIIIGIITLESCAGYMYENEIGLFRLNRNLTKPIYSKTYNKDTWTKDDVLITINSDKILEIMSGDFKLSKDGKTLTKTVSENETGIIRVRDEDYNYDNIEYEVSWIDKEPPKIIEVENGKKYNKDLHLKYTDNGEIDEIFVDKYDDEFTVYTKDVFIDSGSERFVPYNKNSITAWVQTHSKGIEKYRYYLNNVLYATTIENKYTFSGIEEITYGNEIKVEALDRNNNIIATQNYTIKTGIFDEICFEKTETTEQVKFLGISDKVTKMVCYTWIDGKYNSTLKYGNVNIENNEAICKFDIKDFGNEKSKYIMNFYFYYKQDNKEKCFVYGGDIDMSKPYIVLEENKSINDFTVNGNYYVRVTDKAGNESEVDFIIQK